MRLFYNNSKSSSLRYSGGLVTITIVTAVLAGCSSFFTTPDKTSGKLSDGYIVDISKLVEMFDIPVDENSAIVGKLYNPTDPSDSELEAKRNMLKNDLAEAERISKELLEQTTVAQNIASNPIQTSSTSQIVDEMNPAQQELSGKFPTSEITNKLSVIIEANLFSDEVLPSNDITDKSEIITGYVSDDHTSEEISEKTSSDLSASLRSKKIPLPPKVRGSKTLQASATKPYVLPKTSNPLITASVTKENSNVPLPPRIFRSGVQTSSLQNIKTTEEIIAAKPSTINKQAIQDNPSKQQDSLQIQKASRDPVTSTPMPKLPKGAEYVAINNSANEVITQENEHITEIAVNTPTTNIKVSATSEDEIVHNETSEVAKVEKVEVVAAVTADKNNSNLNISNESSKAAVLESNQLLTEAANIAKDGELNSASLDNDASEINNTLVTQQVKFIAPIEGKVIANFGFNRNGWHNDGINIAASEGTQVKAIGDGVVIYAGNDLAGFGNLILIRHSENYVSAYAHAANLMVKRGKTIKQGDIIATVGATGSVQTPQLHFEIRQGTQPINPVKYVASLL